MSFAKLKNVAIAGQLRRSLTNGRLAHAYLFSGRRGAGKLELARTLAKALNCLEAEADSCDRCESCRRIDEGAHPDIYEVKPESKSRRISVDQIRQFERAIHLRPTEARVKLGIVIDADCMGEEASNAFLKTLEEPPAQTVIILLSTEPQRLLPTILSRCLRISFGANGDVAASPLRGKLLPLLSKFSTQAEQKIVHTYRLVAQITGILQDSRNEIRQRVEAETNLDRYEELEPKVRERLEDEMAARIEGEYRAAREQLLEVLYGWFADLLLCVEQADERLLQNADAAPALKRAAARLDYGAASANLEAIDQIRESLFRNISETLAFEVGFLKLASG
jgi:DNA polymerase-3 subunit delta'